MGIMSPIIASGLPNQKTCDAAGALIALKSIGIKEEMKFLGIVSAITCALTDVCVSDFVGSSTFI